MMYILVRMQCVRTMIFLLSLIPSASCFACGEVAAQVFCTTLSDNTCYSEAKLSCSGGWFEVDAACQLVDVAC